MIRRTNAAVLWTSDAARLAAANVRPTKQPLGPPGVRSDDVKRQPAKQLFSMCRGHVCDCGGAFGCSLPLMPDRDGSRIQKHREGDWMAHRQAARRTAHRRRRGAGRQYRNRRQARIFRRDLRTAGPTLPICSSPSPRARRMPVWPPPGRTATPTPGDHHWSATGVSSTSANCRTSTKKRIAAS